MHEYYFERMSVWKDARNLINDIHLITHFFPKEEDFHLKSQMRRSAGSVKSNIAEGQGRRTKKDQIHFTSISYSSLIELLNHLITAYDQEYITEQEYVTIREKIENISKQLSALKRTQELKITGQSTS